MIYRAGILDVLLSVIAKSLTVQIKAKGKTNSGSNLKELNTVTLATSIHPKDNMCSRWWLRGYVSRKLAEVIVHLIKDMASVSITSVVSLLFNTKPYFTGKIIGSVG